ncbi:MAG TPA: phospholipase C, phosphocholine-specific [Acidobacteriaceae bacterium]
MEHTRRDFLKFAALFSGAAGVSGFLPDSIQRAVAIEPEAGSTYLDAEHIVILMQENRSFDHALGTLKGVRGFNDPRAIRLGNGNSVFVQTDAAGDSYAPWRLDIRDTRITWMGSIPHSRNSQVDAWNEGQHNNWVDAKRSHVSQEYAAVPITMGHYTREDIPFYYELADAFTVCDQSYCSVMSSTTPNRSYFWTGTIRDKSSTDSKVYMRNDEINAGGMTWKTFPERLQEAGIGWKFYQNELTNAGGMKGAEESWLGNFGCNILEEFAAYNIEAYPGCVLYMHQRIAWLNKLIAKDTASLATEKDQHKVAQMRWRIQHNGVEIARLKESLKDSGAQRYNEMTPQQRALHHAAFVTNGGDPEYRTLETITFEDDGKELSMEVPKSDILYQFRKDVNEGKLPTVSWVTPPEKFSDHPESPWYGAWYVSEVMDILTKNPEVWKKTIFILTYDENDGYFDHAPSFVAADPKRPATGGASEGIDTGIEYSYAQDEVVQGVAEKDARSGPIGMGFRVPTIVASPWSRGGWVNSQLFDHTSTLMFLEDFVQTKFGKKVREDNISAWRRAISGDLTSCFRRHEAKEPKLEYLNRDKFVISIQKARYKEIPSNYKRLTAAEIREINENLLHAEATTHQESGIRPSCALPYELYAEGGLSADGAKFELRLTAGDKVHGRRSAGAPFNVYLRNVSGSNAKEMRVATYAVKPGDTLREEFPLAAFEDGAYEIDVHGPNGFFRSFRGRAEDAAVQTSAAYERKGKAPTGNVQMKVRNAGAHAVTIAVRDNAYGTGTVSRTVGAGKDASVVLALKQSHGWYDFTVRAEGSKTEARYAGRVETGGPGFSDPLMGGVV